MCMFVCVCPFSRLLIASVMMWCDMDHSLYITAIVGIISRRDLTIEVCHRKQAK